MFKNLTFCFLLGLTLIVGCGDKKDNGSGNGTVATTPTSDPCVNNGGYGCNWNAYPNGFRAYPTGTNGYYNGYNGGVGYTGSYTGGGFNACGSSWAPVYNPQNGLGCVNQNYLPNNGFSYYQADFGNGYQSYHYCDTRIWGSCPNGHACVPLQTGIGNSPQGICQ